MARPLKTPAGGASDGGQMTSGRGGEERRKVLLVITMYVTVRGYHLLFMVGLHHLPMVVICCCGLLGCCENISLHTHVLGYSVFLAILKETVGIHLVTSALPPRVLQ